MHLVFTVTDGDNNTPELQNFLVPLMKKYGVQVYMNGHEHNAEVRNYCPGYLL